MLKNFERTAQRNPQQKFFSFENETLSYGQARYRAITLARGLQLKGVTRGSHVAVSMENCPAFIILFLAAAYGGFTIVPVNPHWSDQDKLRYLKSIEAAHISIGSELTEADVLHILIEMSNDKARDAAASWGKKGLSQFDPYSRAVILFSDSYDEQKSLALTWHMLFEAALACNTRLGSYGKDLWQLVLPFYSVDGLQVVLRALMNASAFMLYRNFDAAQVMEDALDFDATHIAVNNAILKDLVEYAETRGLLDEEESIEGNHVRKETGFKNQSLASILGLQDMKKVPKHANQEDSELVLRERRVLANNNALAFYDVILFNGEIPDEDCLWQAKLMGASVFVSYSTPETAGPIALSRVDENYDGSLKLFPGYSAYIVDPGAEGIGQLAIDGPSIFLSYLKRTKDTTTKGFFRTEQAASMDGRYIKIVGWEYDGYNKRPEF